MKKVNLRDLYPDVYKNDHFVEVTEDVLETIQSAERAEAAYDRRMYRYKAYYSLDCDNGIENAILMKPQTPEMLLEEKQLREQLYAAVMALPEKQATIDGKQFPNDRIAILKEIGSFIEAPSFYANLTGRENLDIIRRILGLPKADVEDALELVGLTEFGDRLAKQYSLGMKQRLGLAGALLGRPPILILDEPTNGLDPSGIHEIRNLVKSLPSLYDCTVLISSHMLSEIELIADDIGILNHGRLLFEGSMNDLRQYALQSGFAADNLEDVFLSMVEKDNMDRKQRAKL